MRILTFSIFLFFAFFSQGVAFPGDHITLTCVKHLPYKVDDATKKVVKDLSLIDKYNKGGDSRTGVISLIRTALKADPAFFERPDIIAEIKQSIKDSGYNRDVPITKWGDSLSDWIDHYGWLPYSNFNYGLFTPGNQGFGGIAGGMNSAQYWAAELRSLRKG